MDKRYIRILAAHQVQSTSFEWHGGAVLLIDTHDDNRVKGVTLEQYGQMRARGEVE